MANFNKNKMDIHYIPQFSQQYIDENKKSLTCSSYDFIAVATGSTINLSYFSNNLINQICPISFSNYPITSIVFHPTEKVIAAGDTSGTIFIYNLISKQILLTQKFSKFSDCIYQICLFNNDLIILFKSKKLISIGFPIQTESIQIKWEIDLKFDFTRISIQNNNFLLYKEDSKIFSIFKLNENSKPEIRFDQIELTTEDSFKDAQWSNHLKDFIFFILPNEIFLFHCQSKVVFPIITQRLTSSSFESMIQLPDDFSSFFIILKNGQIVNFKNSGKLNFSMIDDKQLNQTGQIISAVVSKINSRYCFMFNGSLGLGLFDFLTYKLISYDLFFPSNVTSFDSDGNNYVLGTSNGYIIYGNIYDHKHIKRFLISQNEIKFVSFDSSLSRIYFQSETKLGFIDIAISKICEYSLKFNSILQCYGSRHGCLIIKRDLYTLGIFIEGKEHPLFLENEPIDVSINESESTSLHGSFAILFKHKISFYKYSKNLSITKFKEIQLTILNPTVFAVSGEIIALGYSNGRVLFTDFSTTQQVMTNLSNLQNFKFSLNQNLFGMSKSNSLFAISQNSINVCPYPIKQFQLIDDNTLLVMTIDNSVKFLTLNSSWAFISSLTTYLAVPSENLLLKNYLINQSSVVYSIEGKNAFRNQLFDSLNINNSIKTEIFEDVQNDSDDILKIKIENLIFNDHLNEAGEYLFKYSQNNFENSILASLIFQFGSFSNSQPDNLSNHMSENDPCMFHQIDKAKARLKQSAIFLCEKGDFLNASFLFRLGQLDQFAVNCLIDYNQVQFALQFIQKVPEDIQK